MSKQPDLDRPIPFSLVAGGPYHSALGRLGLLGPEGLPTWRTAIVLAMLVWLLPAVLAVIQATQYPAYDGWAYFRDGTVYTRYLVAIVVMVTTERFADGRISLMVNQFLQARLLQPEARDRFRVIVAKTDQLASRTEIELLLLVLALAWSWLSTYFVSTVFVGGWEELSIAGEERLSWAGMTALLVSNPVFLFLLLRWCWRFVVWTLLLIRVSRLPLQLTALHPDRAGGLNFLALFPIIFCGQVFALSCVVSASLMKSMAVLDSASEQLIWVAVAVWVVLMMLIFLAPVLTFSSAMYRVREHAILEFGRLAQIHHLEFQKKWLVKRQDPETILGSEDPSSVADLNGAVQTALEMRVVPLDWTAIILLLCASLAPFIVILLAEVPLAELLKWLAVTIF